MPDTPIPGHPRLSWWRRWSGFIALAALVLVSAAGFFKLEGEGHRRESQFCQLILGQHEDKAKRVSQTQEFLDTPAGMEKTGINEYIRDVSLPQSEDELQKEQEKIPILCWKYKED